MYYRRNGDEGIRNLENAWNLNPEDIDALSALNRARRRAGLEPFRMDHPLDEYILLNRLRSIVSKHFWISDVEKTQFPAYKLDRRISDDSYPITPRTRQQIEEVESKLLEAVPLIVEAGWVALLVRYPLIELKIIRKRETNEYVVQWKENGQVNDRRCYFTDDKFDAESTMRHMESDIKRHYSELYFVPRSVIQRSGDIVRVPPRGEVIADAWKKNEEPRSLADPSFRQGSYPVKNVLVFDAGRCPKCHGSGHDFITKGKKRIMLDCQCREMDPKDVGSYCVWDYIIPYDEGRDPYYNDGHYDMMKNDGYSNYLARLLKVSYTAFSKIFF